MEILVIDDDPSVQWIIQKALGRRHRVLEASTLGEARPLLRQVQLVFLDIYLPDGSGLVFLEELLQGEAPPLVVLMTGRGGPGTVMEAMKRGAMDYLPKPFDLVRLRSLVREAEALVTREEEGEEEEGEGFVSRSPVMEEVLKRMGRLAAADLSVLITGEDGVGKTAAARYIHAHSTRKNGPLVVFAPARLPSARVEAELFGKGGKLEKAKGGTLVIQQVEQLVPEIQEKLLAALENGEYLVPGGGFTPLYARVIATTSKDLPRMVVEGGFNEDLFLRLQTFTVEIPPLRERAEDVPLLAEYFLKRAAGKRKVRGVTSQAMEALMKYRWPGNVKELKEVIERLVPLARGQPISVDLLPLVIRENREQPAFIAYLREEVKRMLKEGEEDIYGKIVGQVEKVLLEEVLSQTQGNQIMASRILGVHRNTIRRKLSVFGGRGR